MYEYIEEFVLVLNNLIFFPTSQMNKLILTTLFVFQAIVWFLVTTKVPYAYMDEIFHINQYLSFNRWIRGEDFFWDPSITTFPGLYLFSLIPAIPLTFGLDTASGHVVSILRGVNAFIVLPAIFLVVYRLCNRSIMIATIVSMIPLNWFYSHLYYTDNLSTLFVLLVYMFQKEGKLVASGFAGVCAVLARQTNIVWVFGFSVLSLWENLNASNPFVGLKKLRVQIFLGISFVLFLRKNNWSVVLGHHEHHSLSLHWAQINYAIITILAISWPLIFQKMNLSKISWTKFVVIFALSAAFSEMGTIVHPFIVSDHRHYSFYLFKRFLSTRWIRSLVIPMVVAATVSSTAGRINPLSYVSNRNLARVIFLFCTIVIIVPSPLIEFRYFNIPLTLLVIELVKSASQTQRLVTLFLSMLVNGITMFVFLYRPFDSPDWGTSRFMY